MATLRRELSRWDLTAIGINQVIGAAIFLLPADVARQVGAWGWLMFLFVGLTSLLIALCFAEAGSRFETTGGPIVPARAAFGRFVGFEVGWMMWFTRVASGASVINGLALALGFYWPLMAAGAPRVGLIVGLMTALTWVNLRGIRQSSLVVNVLTAGKLVPLFLFVLAGIWFIEPSRLTAGGPITVDQAGTAAVLLVFGYGGYEVTGILAGEAANPRRDVPFAFVVTLLVVVAVMTLAAVTATGLLPDLAATRTPIADASAVVMGAFGGLLVSVGSSLAMAGNCHGQLLNGSRSLFALAEGGDLPAWFGRVHPRFQTPSNAILFSGVVLVALALSGSFAVLAAVSAVARIVIYVSTCGAVLRLRHPAFADVVAPATFRAPAGPVLPWLAIAIMLGILASATGQQLLSGVLALVVGAGLYVVATRRG
jgi:APA family basic amino acid/polyamine antiporter